MSRRLAVLLAVFVIAAAVACNENLDGGAACPALCPAQNVAIRDTLIDPVLVFDSTFIGYPERGQELGMLLASRGDSIDVRGIIRFDSLTTSFVPAGDTARPITHVDSSQVRLVLDRRGAKIPTQVTFDVYDVDDTTAADTASAPLLARFGASQRIGTRTWLRDSLPDTLFVPLADSAVLDKLTSQRRLRLGVRVSGNASVSLRVQTIESGYPARLLYKPTTTDTSVHILTVGPTSATPAGSEDPEIRQDLTDFSLVAKYGLPQYPNTMAVGGMPGRRAYLRFNVPSYITDSNTVVRATLRLTQRPLPFGDATDTMVVHAHVVLAGPQVTDLRRATNIITTALLLVNDSLLIVPRDSGVHAIEIFGLVRAWSNQKTLVNPPPHAVVLRAAPEGLLPLEARFYSSTAPAGLRPVMRISYVPRATFGVP
jgi:hypothetical protein